jgi:tetraacyldisaccharide 4'-kinase
MNADWARGIWERKGIACQILWLLFVPLSFLYGLGVWVRNLLYAFEWLRPKSLPRPVVSIGNLTVGGTGKTPTTLWLADQLERRGYRVAILSRGYKRSEKQCVVLEPRGERGHFFSEVEELRAAGDEPVMMARVFGHRVGVGAARHEVGAQMLRDGEVDVFILDDGFQHRRLKRDLDLLLLGSDWEGWLIPAGPFRESRRSLKRADLCLVTGARERWERLLRRRPAETTFFGTLEPRALVGLEAGRWKEYPLTILGRNKVLAVAGIADPGLFYHVIDEWEGEIVDTMQFPDHYNYSARDWQNINRAAREVDLIVTTEKDLVKLARFPFAREKLLALRVEMAVENGEALVQAVEKVIRGRQPEF